MSNIKKVFFLIGNLVIGILAYYVYLYFWVLFSWGEPFQLNLLETFISLTLSVVVFLGFNYFLLRKVTSSKPYWWSGAGIVIFAIVCILIILAYS
ncbi:hypothetical protein [Alteribacillus bidgolensis]|uniref:Uncharacterized protein n=1 Tax=Alteribacillus bidgolensis TaxID=930129 RepID=A0A1G8NMJ1_9BACI|nr:hypothetical protein [Alteribacillus bidgolensis]SDI81206.1 hypothetical protein SAMN05216352_11275 [Alteribacillus bidgolensis]